MNKSKLMRSRTHWFFLAPHLVIFTVFFVIPIMYGIYVSFTKWDMFSSPVWAGLSNYKTILFNQESTFYRQFWNGFKNTFLFVVMMVPIQVTIPLLVALALFARPKGARIFQAIFYIPTLFSISAVILTWYFILHPSYGFINKMFNIYINWFGEQPYAWISILVVTTWWMVGGNMVIYVAALHNIDGEILEYAKLDGISGLRKLISIYLPLIKFPFLFTIISSTTAQFNIYGQPLMLTRGGPAEGTSVLIMYIRRIAFGTGKPIAGMASAMAVLLGLCIGIFSVLQMTVLIKQDTN